MSGLVKVSVSRDLIIKSRSRSRFHETQSQSLGLDLTRPKMKVSVSVLFLRPGKLLVSPIMFSRLPSKDWMYKIKGNSKQIFSYNHICGLLIQSFFSFVCTKIIILYFLRPFGCTLQNLGQLLFFSLVLLFFYIQTLTCLCLQIYMVLFTMK